MTPSPRLRRSLLFVPGAEPRKIEKARGIGADTLLIDAYSDGSAPFFLNRGSVRRRARRVLERAGFDLPLDADFADLPPADRQLLAIARAIDRSASLLILDEPTASLSGREAERLYEILRGQRARGLAILYISHRIADLKALADRVAVPTRAGEGLSARRDGMTYAVCTVAVPGLRRRKQRLHDRRRLHTRRSLRCESGDEVLDKSAGLRVCGRGPVVVSQCVRDSGERSAYEVRPVFAPRMSK